MFGANPLAADEVLSTGGGLVSALTAQKALQFGGELVSRQQVAEGRGRYALLPVLLRFQLADHGGVLVAARDQLLDLLVGGRRGRLQGGRVDLQVGDAGQAVEQGRGRGRVGHGRGVVVDSGPQADGVAGDGAGGVEAKLDALLDKVRDDEAARQEFVDLLEVLGPEDPRTASYRKALTARLF
jgi:hypothetical protein